MLALPAACVRVINADDAVICRHSRVDADDGAACVRVDGADDDAARGRLITCVSGRSWNTDHTYVRKLK
jgi:hypothetical protein